MLFRSEEYEKEKIITGLDSIEGSIAFHAGTKILNGNVVIPLLSTP